MKLYDRIERNVRMVFGYKKGTALTRITTGILIVIVICLAFNVTNDVARFVLSLFIVFFTLYLLDERETKKRIGYRQSINQRAGQECIFRRIEPSGQFVELLVKLRYMHGDLTWCVRALEVPKRISAYYKVDEEIDAGATELYLI